MVRSYLRHGPTEAFGVVASSSSNSVFDGKKAYVPALEDVLVWDVKKGEQAGMWHETGLKALVTCIARSPTTWEVFAVGYEDGSVRLWNSQTKDVIVTLNGHKKAVTALAWDHDGARLASGSKDTNIIVWDTVAEVGLFRLQGHRDQITQLAFVAPEQDRPSTSSSTALSASSHLLSCSKDTFMKLFDLKTQHCIETIVAHRSEAWSFAYDAASNVILSGGGECETKCWTLDKQVLTHGPSTDDKTGKLKRAIVALPPLTLRNTNHSHRVSQISFHSTLPILAILSGEKTIDVYRLRTEDEMRKKVARRRKRERERKQKHDEAEDEDDDAAEEAASEQTHWRDRLALWTVVRAPFKIRSFSFSVETAKAKGDVQIMTTLANNLVEVYHLPPAAASKAPLVEPERLYSVDLPGHRTDIRTLALSSDDELLASASNGSVKIWSMKTFKCVRTLECGYALCSAFLPGDRHLVVGTKSGELMLYDVGSSSLLETFKAHSDALWSLSVRPDGRGLVTGSADKDVKFWDFTVRQVAIDADNDDEEASAGATTKQVLTMEHVKTLKMTDDVLSIKYSPDGRLLAISLLDSTVKVFYSDTLKFFLSLYGHKLPVLSLDISDDSKLIVTCSADKNVKIWGLDFGDCHRSLFAHEDSVMQVAFERASHCFWTVSKDRVVKYWDGDKFELIQKLEGHQGEVWSLVTSRKSGSFVVTGSHDKSLRIWEKTDEPLFLEEERERELEAMYDAAAAARDDALQSMTVKKDGRDNDQDVEGEQAGEVTKSTTETLMAGERIIEALELSAQDFESEQAYEQAVARTGGGAAAALPPRTRNAVFEMNDGIGRQEYVLKVVRAIPAASLQDALLVLPFGKVIELIEHVDYWASRGWHMSLTSRVLFFLLRTHHSQIVATRALRKTMVSLRRHLRDSLERQKSMLGYNLAAVKYIERRRVQETTSDFVAEPVVGLGDETSVKKKRQAALLS